MSVFLKFFTRTPGTSVPCMTSIATSRRTSRQLDTYESMAERPYYLFGGWAELKAIEAGVIILPPGTEADDGAAHGADGNVSCEDYEVRP